MKKCPHCAEEIQDAAIVCKHCKTKLVESPVVQAASNTQEVEASKSKSKSGMSLIRISGWFILGIFALVFWYLSIPIIVTWYLFKKKKNKYSLKANLIISGSTLVVCLVAIAALAHANRAPKLMLTDPQDQAVFQTKTVTVKGTVDPSSSVLKINGQSMKAGNNGSFTYELPLNDEKNVITVVATNGSKSQTQNITVQRTFTAEELAERERQKAAAEQAQKDKDAKIAQEKVDQAKERLQKELDSFKKPFDNTAYRGSVINLTLELALFGAWGNIVTEYKGNPDPEVKAMAVELEQKVSKLQTVEFPLLRKAYGEVVAKGLWESNIDVQTSGAGNKTIGLTSAIFASNKNIAQAQGSIGENLKLFRFTRVNYKWYKYDDEYQYYSIESKPDGAVVGLEK